MEKIEQAFILAAGFGKRLLPVTKLTPKPLINVNGIIIIESIIEGLIKKGIKNIKIIIGYKAYKFTYLIKKYNGYVTLIYNNDYKTSNNISSIYSAAKYMNKTTIIVEGDFIIKNYNVFLTEIEFSTYTLGYSKIPSKEWGVILNENGLILKVNKEITSDGYYIKGLSYWLKSDFIKLKKHILKNYLSNSQFFWDEVPLILHKNLFLIKGVFYDHEYFLEIDTYDELLNIDKKYKRKIL
jgi:CTP:phosphocholine cytidylyltransferase-like protein